MIYSPIPEEAIFQDVIWAAAKPKKLLQYQGVYVEVEELSSGEIKIERIVSTDPDDYLIAALQPGSKIKYY
jgi:beta-lactam-binding protein with PASTA domain